VAPARCLFYSVCRGSSAPSPSSTPRTTRDYGISREFSTSVLSVVSRNVYFARPDLLFLACRASRCRRDYILPLCFSFFFLSSFSRLMFEFTERISTKFGHIFTYESYLENFVRTPRAFTSTGWGHKTAFWDRLRTLTEYISAKEHDIHN